MSSRVSADWSPMDHSMTLVACGGKWVPATPAQLELITRGENACMHQQMSESYRTPVMYGYEYVVGVGGRDNYLKNVTTCKCRKVLIVPKPAVWDEFPRGF